MRYLVFVVLLAGCYPTSGVVGNTKWKVNQATATLDFTPRIKAIMISAAQQYERTTGIKVPDNAYDDLAVIEVCWHDSLFCSQSESGRCNGLFGVRDGKGHIKTYTLDHLTHELYHYLDWRLFGRGGWEHKNELY